MAHYDEFTERQVGNRLTKAGFKVTQIAKGNIDVDGEVTLEDGLSVHVRFILPSYIACLEESKGESVTQRFAPSRDTVAEVIEDLKAYKKRMIK